MTSSTPRLPGIMTEADFALLSEEEKAGALHLAMEERCEDFNAAHPPGSMIKVLPVRGEPEFYVRTVSNYGAQVLGGHSPVVYVTDGGGNWHLDNVMGAATEADIEAAAPSPALRRLERLLGTEPINFEERDRHGAMNFVWRDHQFRVAADGFVEELVDGFQKTDLGRLMERLLEVGE